MGKLFQFSVVAIAAWFGLSALGLNPFSGDRSQGLEELIQRAQTEGKYKIVVLLTGTEWCPYCQELDRNVIDTDAWKSFADLQVVFAKYEYPATGRPRSGVKSEMLRRYDPSGFPTLVVLDDEGAVLGKEAGYSGRPFSYYKEWIESL